jgi:hypothetical protein
MEIKKKDQPDWINKIITQVNGEQLEAASPDSINSQIETINPT